jgi:hypothetical protein
MASLLPKQLTFAAYVGCVWACLLFQGIEAHQLSLSLSPASARAPTASPHSQYCIPPTLPRSFPPSLQPTITSQQLISQPEIMRFSTSFLVAASMLFTVHAHDKDWRLPEEAGAVAARAVAARATAARAAAANAFNPPVSGAIEPKEPLLRLLHRMYT